MLHELAAASFSYDATTDTAHVTAHGAAGPGGLGLFDAKGFLVGLDLRGDDGRGTVVMLGPHEAVTETRPLSVTIRGDDVVIAGATAHVRGADPNPYV